MQPERAKPEYRRGKTITEQSRPRVLLVGIDDGTLEERLRHKIPTLLAVESLWGLLDGIDLHEWDCVVTHGDYTSIHETHMGHADRYGSDAPSTWTWTQHLPSHLSLIYAPSATKGTRSFDMLDFRPAEGKDSDDLPRAAVVRDGVYGRHITTVEGLPVEITDLVNQRLLPIAQNRSRHTYFEVRGELSPTDQDFALRPFLFGPRDVALAGSYPRTSEASVWLLPPDVDDLAPWVLAALREWHSLYPDRFPTLPDWPNDPAYRSADEARLHQRLEARTQAFQAEMQKYLTDKQDIESQLAEAAEAADRYERALLTGQGEELEAAIAAAFRALGFGVEDMDEKWPAQARREDYRITDPDESDWIAVGEAKGFTKGVRETGLVSLGRWVEMFAVEERRLPSARWYIANQHLRDDPGTRPTPLAARRDVVEAFAEGGGLVLDTAALFALLRAVQDDTDLATPVRQRLKARRGVFAASDAEALIADIRASASEMET